MTREKKPKTVPKPKHMVSLDLGPELKAQLYELAQKEERSVSQMVKIAIREMINKRGIQLKVFS